tara:strand:+ start:487 stop:1347 length:861 start_codon:yes stop_codon:yes gene_type:complete
MIKKREFRILLAILLFFSGSLSTYFLRSFNFSSNNNQTEDKKYSDLKSKHLEWVQNLKKGGYVIHLRHAMREKWDTVVAFDALELQNNDDARNEDYYRAVCLTEKGILESKLVGEVFKRSNIEVSYVVSSPSCRARETAIFAFNRIDQIEPSILHRTAQIESQHKDYGIKLREVLDSIKIEEGKNIIISGHGGTLSYDLKNGVGIVDINEVENIDDRLETGMIIIERKNNKYIARHKFNVISDISTNSLKLQIDDESNDKFLFKDNEKYNPKNINKGLIYNTYNKD